MAKKSAAKKRPKLEQGILELMQALDSQVARALERTPAEREIHGVQKWEPLGEKVEQVSAFVLESFAGRAITLDALLICAEAFGKSLRLIVDELGSEGLGQIRTRYCEQALERPRPPRQQRDCCGHQRNYDRQNH